MRARRLLFFTIFLIHGCSSDPVDTSLKWQTFLGRDEAFSSNRITRHPVYQAQVPTTWKRKDPDPKTSNYDTTLAIVTFYIEDEIEITVHNFPADTIDSRIPPNAQVARWRRQLESSEEGTTQPVAHGGYWGLYFEGSGSLKGEARTVYAWAMQLNPQHFQSLLFPSAPEAQHFYRQMRADYTIKAVGPNALMKKHRKALHRFAQSFELIQEIPVRS